MAEWHAPVVVTLSVNQLELIANALLVMMCKRA